MKYILPLILLLLIITNSYGQAKRSGKVKRKYRNVEQAPKNLQPVYLRGAIYDIQNMPVIGANVTVDGTTKGVHTNQNGEFLIENLQTGKARIRVSYVGFQTKTTDVILRPGETFKNIMLREDKIHLPAITVNSQKREQQILDVPAAISAVSSETIEQSNITELGQMSEFVPGLYIREQGANRPSFVIRGLTSDEVSPSAQARISTYYNNVPINRASSASVELFDMERVEVLKGPQNTLFGRGAQAGAVHFISKMPTNTFHGKISVGGGNYSQKEIKGAINSPLIKDKLFVRVAGIYSVRDGYIENTFGGTLNGKETTAGRFSARFIPSWNHKLDLVVNYQKDDTPGIAFMSGSFPNTNGITDIYGGIASLEQGENLGTGKEFYDATLNYKYYINEHKYWSSVSSYRNSSSSARWDGDGTASAAIDMAETGNAEQFYQEIRLNFARKSRLNGSFGASYWWEKADQAYWFSPNEQHFASLLLMQPPMPVDPSGNPIVIPQIPANPEMGLPIDLPLPEHHEEEKYNKAINQAAEIFMDGTYQINKRIFLTAGIRGVFDMYQLSDSAAFTRGSPSTLGMFFGEYPGNLPNLFFKPGAEKEISKNTFSFTGRAGLQYKFNEYGNVFVNYARGRRPNVLQFSSTGEEEILDAEILDNFDLGFKGTFFERVYFNAVGFYQLYKNFQSSAWVADAGSGEFNYKVTDSGKATSYGAEASIKVAVLEQLDLFGNYAWLHTAFDSTDVDGNEQEYAANSFRLSPEHSFTFGINARANITENIKIFVTPSYSYKTDMFFEDANTPGLEQEAYGLLNINGGLELAEPSVILSVHASNVLDEKYATSGGNTGSLFGVPTFVPGAPRMFGAKLNWKFQPGKKKTISKSPSGLFKKKMY